MHGTIAPGASREASLRACMIAGLVDTLVTLAALLAAHSSVLLADTLKTFLEFVAVMLAWVAIRRISKGGGKTYEYGLDKLENLSSLFVGLLMFCCLTVIMISAVKSIMHPGHISGAGIWISMIAQVVYGVINGWLWLKNRRLAIESNSPLMSSQARLFFTRTFGNVFILLSLLLSISLSGFSWSAYIDPAASLVIAASILIGALGIFSSSIYDLLDRTLEESDQMLILRELAHHFDEYSNLHGIRSRRAGSLAFVEIFLEFSPERSVAEVQKVIDAIRQNLEKQIPGARVAIALTDRPEA